MRSHNMEKLCPICNPPRTDVERLTVKLAAQAAVKIKEEEQARNRAAWACLKSKPRGIPQ
jgi:hypothetical protein